MGARRLAGKHAAPPGEGVSIAASTVIVVVIGS